MLVEFVREYHDFIVFVILILAIVINIITINFILIDTQKIKDDVYGVKTSVDSTHLDIKIIYNWTERVDTSINDLTKLVKKTKKKKEKQCTTDL